MSDKDDLLIEIGTEELPPTSIRTLSLAFSKAVITGLQQAELAFDDANDYATPRRLAVLVKGLQATQDIQYIEKKGPAVKAAYDSDGNPTKAALGFAKSCGIELSQCQTIKMPNGEYLAYSYEESGKAIDQLIPGIIEQALAKLPVAKMMRWGDYDIQFVRPIKWITLIYGKKSINTTIWNIKTEGHSYGHRFHHPGEVKIKSANDYADSLKKAYVMADFMERQHTIEEQITKQAVSVGGHAHTDQDLLTEVTGLVEWPVALVANYHERFLQVPQEALISSMRTHQKCFPVVNSENHLLPYFITVSNIESKQPEQVLDGNQRVMAARLSDAEFFYQTDLKHNLESYFEQLRHVVFQAKLGNLYEKSQRLADLSKIIAGKIDADGEQAYRSGLLAKADLMTEMVGEFPELQGIMGYYYALHEHEAPEIALALKEHYMPRLAKAQLPQSAIGCSVAIADRLDTLVGLFGINKPPTGEKDPFGLRRAALAVLRIIIENNLSLDLHELLSQAVQCYQINLPNDKVVDQSFDFIVERLRTWYLEQGISPEIFAAVMANKPTQPLDFHRRIQAVNHFCELPEADSLTAANKRVSRLLLKQEDITIERTIAEELLSAEQEKHLAQLILQKRDQVMPLYQQANYTEALAALASLREPVDQFFDEVMVMVDDEKVRMNRLSLLANLRDLFLEVADISLL